MHRLVTGTLEWRSLPVLAALCDILELNPAELIVTSAANIAPCNAVSGGALTPVDLAMVRPRRARVRPGLMDHPYATTEQYERWFIRVCARCGRRSSFTVRWPDRHVCRTCHDRARPAYGPLLVKPLGPRRHTDLPMTVPDRAIWFEKFGYRFAILSVGSRNQMHDGSNEKGSMSDAREQTQDLVIPEVTMTEVGESLKVFTGDATFQISNHAAAKIKSYSELLLHWDGRGLVGDLRATVPVGSVDAGSFPRFTEVNLTEGELTASSVPIEVERSDGLSLLQPTLFRDKESLEFNYRIKSPFLEFASTSPKFKSVTAHLLNAPRYLGMKIDVSEPDPPRKGHFSTRGRLILTSQGWRVTIDYLPCWAIDSHGFWDDPEGSTGSKIISSLRNAASIGGPFVTHAVRLERTKGSIFSREQALSALSRLETFLRFAFGGPGQPILVHGRDHLGALGWKRLPVSPVLPITGGRRATRSWIPLAGDSVGTDTSGVARVLNSHLSLGFESWMQQSEDGSSQFSRTLARAVDWYVASLESSTQNQGVILAQASFAPDPPKPRQPVVRPRPLAVIKAGAIEEVMAKLAEAKAQFPEAVVRSGRHGRWELWPPA